MNSIKEILDNEIIVKFENNEENIVNHFFKFTSNNSILIGEIINARDNLATINLIGEIRNNEFMYGISKKPDFNSKIELVSEDEVKSIISFPDLKTKSLCLGKSAIYDNININMDLNSFFNSHFAILGGTGSGKSFGLARIIQTIFANNEFIPYRANFFVFDTFGEYQNAFKGIENNNPYIKTKILTTNLNSNDEILKIPAYLLGIDDLAILLNATTPSQLQILDKALKLVNIFASSNEKIIKVKNDIIARAILDILLSGRPSVQIRDQIFSILAFYKTEELNLETTIYQPGYNRALKHCLLIDADGKIREIELLTEFFSNYLLEKKDDLPHENVHYTLKDLEDAIDFALISEGILKSETIYDNNNLLKVRIHSLINSEYKNYFEYSEFLTLEDYVNRLLVVNQTKAQIINFNINYVDDRFAKCIVKIISRMLFDILKNYKPRASFPFHIILEEAHRYVQNDNDINLLGYNIFDRIAKEGRKYGILLGLISQRPNELSETTLSQCNNYLIFKISHPKDIDYINKLIPYIDSKISKQIQIMKPGYCYTFGSAFKIPIVVKIDLPNPIPISNNVDISKTWYIQKN